MMLQESPWNLNAPLVIAHRGASLIAPENTLTAFRMAAELGADAVELDAKLSADRHVVVHHDKTLDRTTDGTGPLSVRTLEELQRLDAGSHFDPKYAGERIPTLKQVFQDVGDRLLLNIELTNYAHPFDTLPEAVVKMVYEFGLMKRVLLSSFNPIALLKAKRLAPEIAVGLLVSESEPAWLIAFFRFMTSYEAYHPSFPMVQKQLIQREHAQGHRVNVWTINEKDHIRDMLNIGVDGMITDAPELAREVVEEFKTGRVGR
jgi:glycerophosphoryl diester phosphodiesterase